MNDEEEVRRLLADARATGPMPADVQARLDAVLGELSSERAAASPEKTPPAQAVVVDLPSRRRRRAKTLLIAAAAVTVLGLGVPKVLSDMSGQNEDAATSGSAADTSAGRAAEDGTDSGSSGALQDEPDAPAEDAPNAAAPGAVPPQVRPKSFAADAEAARDLAARAGLSAVTTLDPKCLAAASRVSDLNSIPVRYGRLDAALVLGEPRNGSQKATLYVCGESAPRRTTVLSAR